jgi:hydrogenase maturation protease
LSSEEAVREVLVLGVGNDLMRDDGAGTEVARRLQAEDLGPGVEVIAGGVAGLDLIFDLEGRARAILVDAAHMGLAPGDVRVVRREEIEDRIKAKKTGRMGAMAAE